jgi:glycosyltransferase involved in cell wall biosynthesis
LYQSQVINHIEELRRYFQVHEIILDSDINRSTVHSSENVLKYKSIKGDLTYLISKANFILQYKEVSSYLQNIFFDMIYARGIRGGLVGHLINSQFNYELPLINDVRGDVLDENKENIVKKMVLHHANRKIFKGTNYIFTVSSYLRDKINAEYNFPVDNIEVFPTFVPDNKFEFNKKSRKAIRDDLGYDDEDVVLFYSGSAAKHQNIDCILSAFSKSKNEQLKLLILTRDNERMIPKIRKANLSEGDFQMFSVPYQDIQKYYHAADVGLLIRDNTDTNKSASPTKFSEYVNSGLYLCINEIESDYVKQFKELNLQGRLLSDKNDLKHFFEDLDQSSIKRNQVKINSLGILVENQVDILSSIK